jgi:cystathionine gamma-lyase
MSLSGFGTRAIHVGSAPSEETGAVIPPISLATTYAQSAVGVHKGYEYTRSGNPNRDQLESLLASLEADGQYALAFSSGSATTSVVLQALDRDAHVLSVNDVYGGTFRYMTKVSGLDVSFLDLEHTDDEAVRNAIRPNTKVSTLHSAAGFITRDLCLLNY